ncbi:phospholipase A2 inhibitor and Ly6/PLAUR domain-containing protein-like [Rana temporaria]|uniref:phospholipase A2 inhibitor and Ly6/PLAUR domain-containing protein-like n=1 Tax=Rana temporaria TaxID=8407 RepID=UPI001AAE11F7|nr:phospholipase A2 inhibitor and Ly6/PLAUR domain-containing protein-like [Rana temporaria]
MNCILAFLIFSGVIATGSAKSCYTCKVLGEGNNDCPGDLQECPNEDDFCVNQRESSRIVTPSGIDNKVTIKKGCMPIANKNVCQQQPIALDCNEMTFSLYSECCFEDECNLKGLQIPADNTTKNGLECPTCFVEEKEACPKAEPKKCTGNANICLDFTGHVQRPDDANKLYAFQGCADENICKINLKDLPGCEVGDDAKLTCTQKENV